MAIGQKEVMAHMLAISSPTRQIRTIIYECGIYAMDLPTVLSVMEHDWDLRHAVEGAWLFEGTAEEEEERAATLVDFMRLFHSLSLQETLGQFNEIQKSSSATNETAHCSLCALTFVRRTSSPTYWNVMVVFYQTLFVSGWQGLTEDERLDLNSEHAQINLDMGLTVGGLLWVDSCCACVDKPAIRRAHSEQAAFALLSQLIRSNNLVFPPDLSYVIVHIQNIFEMCEMCYGYAKKWFPAFVKNANDGDTLTIPGSLWCGYPLEDYLPNTARLPMRRLDKKCTGELTEYGVASRSRQTDAEYVSKESELDGNSDFE
jgi:hypothetical protein